jgi:hypothetical protein
MASGMAAKFGTLPGLAVAVMLQAAGRAAPVVRNVSFGSAASIWPVIPHMGVLPQMEMPEQPGCRCKGRAVFPRRRVKRSKILLIVSGARKSTADGSVEAGQAAVRQRGDLRKMINRLMRSL